MAVASAPAPYAKVLRQAAPEIVIVDGGRALAIPLRGRRRALGVLLLERLAAEAPVPIAHMLDAAGVLGRQVSAAIENTILFEDTLQSRRELENTFNSLGDLVVVCDQHGRVTNVNRAFRERVATRVAQPVDRPIAELVGEELTRWLSTALARGLSPEGEARECEDPILSGHFSVRVTPLFGKDRVAQGIVVVARDQTEQHLLQAERAALGERLAQSEKLAALGQFVAGVAHELNNPLQGVLGHLELLRTTKRVPRSLQADLRVVYREADRAARIVNNLLVFAGSRRGAKRIVNVNAVVSRSASARSRIARQRGIGIARDLDPALPGVRGDSMLLQQALLNIIINAEHAIASGDPGRGEISITTRSEARRTRVVIEVRDTGPGVPADALPRIFEPFFTTKGVGEGTGLGLALAYGIVQDHAGEISARNDRRGGAVFRIVLPAAAMEARRPAHHD
jgi:signal transduction histidine kinase